MNTAISDSSSSDIPQLCQLINSAYRGEAAKEGWTHEAGLIEGDKRADEAYLQQVLNDPTAAILKYSEGGKLIGCVYVQKQASDVYLGMLSVQPKLQAQGVGKKLIAAAEEWALQQNYSSIIMQVISVRDELIGWYNRLGYADTGIRKPFDAPAEFGKPRTALEFMVLRKQLK